MEQTVAERNVWMVEWYVRQRICARFVRMLGGKQEAVAWFGLPYVMAVRAWETKGLDESRLFGFVRRALRWAQLRGDSCGPIRLPGMDSWSKLDAESVERIQQIIASRDLHLDPLKIPATPADQDEHIDLADQVERLSKAVRSLPAKQRRLVCLHYGLDGVSPIPIAQLARARGVGPAAIYARLERIKRRLKVLVLEESGESLHLCGQSR